MRAPGSLAATATARRTAARSAAPIAHRREKRGRRSARRSLERRDREPGDGECAEDEGEGQPVAVRSADGEREAVRRQPRLSQRPGAHESRSGSGDREVDEPLHAVAAERERDDHGGQGGQDASARERQRKADPQEIGEDDRERAQAGAPSGEAGEPEREREPEGEEEGERIPVPDRRAQAGDPLAVRVERREDLDGEPHGENDADHERQLGSSDGGGAANEAAGQDARRRGVRGRRLRGRSSSTSGRARPTRRSISRTTPRMRSRAPGTRARFRRGGGVRPAPARPAARTPSARTSAAPPTQRSESSSEASPAKTQAARRAR